MCAAWLIGWSGRAATQRSLSLRVRTSPQSFLHLVIGMSLQVPDCVAPHTHMLLTSCMIRAERDPNDPEYLRLKPVGVYPVSNGWARINLDEVAGKGQGYYSPLYIAPVTAFGLLHRRPVQMPGGLPEVALPTRRTAKQTFKGILEADAI